MFRPLAPVLFAALTLAACRTPPAPPAAPIPPTSRGGPARLVFEGVDVFDGHALVADQRVVVEGDHVASVGPLEGEPPAGAVVIEGAGRTLLPGLIDAHTHVHGPAHLAQAAIFGVTTELDMGMPAEAIAGLKAAARAGGMADLRTAGSFITPPGGHGTEYGVPVATLSPGEDVQAFVDARIAEGSDYLKLIYDDGGTVGVSFARLPEAQLGPVMEAAHRRGKEVVAHIGSREEARAVLQAGADGLAHVFADAEADDALLDLAAARGAFVVPTLTVLEVITRRDAPSTLPGDPDLDPFFTAQDLGALSRRFPGAETQDDLAVALEATRRLHGRGVPILAGTDAPNPGTVHGASLHRELELLVTAGLSPAEALAAATSAPAEAFGLRDRGRIEAGARADLVLVEGDPTRDVRDARRIEGVWVAGAPIDRDAYAARAAASRAAAAGRPSPACESGVLGSFEGLNPGEAPGRGWLPSADAMFGGKSTAQITVLGEGADGTAGSLRATGTVAAGFAVPWGGAALYPGGGPTSAADLRCAEGLSVSLRGDGAPLRIMLFAASRQGAPTQVVVPTTGAWQTHHLRFSDFDGLDGAGILAIVFAAGPAAGPFTFDVDELRLDGVAGGP